MATTLAIGRIQGLMTCEKKLGENQRGISVTVKPHYQNFRKPSPCN